MKRIIFILSLVIIAGNCFAQKFTATASKTKVAVGEQFQVTYSLNANDGWIRAIAAAPAFTSAQAAGEMVENYGAALARDVPFNEFETSGFVVDAVNELNQLTDFRGPKIDGQVTWQTYLRGNTPGDLVGPYISQFPNESVYFISSVSIHL